MRRSATPPFSTWWGLPGWGGTRSSWCMPGECPHQSSLLPGWWVLKKKSLVTSRVFPAACSHLFVSQHFFPLLFRFTSALIYQGLVMRLGIVGGNLYLDFFISGAVELPAALLILVTIDRIGRRLPFAISNIVAGIACLITAFLPEGNSLPRVRLFRSMTSLWHPLSKDSRPHKTLDKSKKCLVMQGAPQSWNNIPYLLIDCPGTCNGHTFDGWWGVSGCSLRKNVYKGPVLFLKANARQEYTNIKGKYIPWLGRHLMMSEIGDLAEAAWWSSHWQIKQCKPQHAIGAVADNMEVVALPSLSQGFGQC